MSYQVLARKWRPQVFADVVGQDHVLRALINALEQQRLHHAYLFTGARGVGKTTLARILARCLNCETGITATPCGECSACREISEGRFVDLIEVDAASRTKVEDTRDLLENVQYAPTRGRFKIYLIDEVHMLSTHSFNALLKTLEEPPEHVKFLLATTDPQKLPVTVLSRCLQFNLKNLGAAQIVEYLQQILAVENIPAEEHALWQLATAATGSMRDALSLTDQAIAHGNGQLREQEVAAMLGTVDQAHIHQLLQALIAGDGEALLKQCDELAQLAVDYTGLVDQLLESMHRIALAKTLPSISHRSRIDDHQVATYAAALAAEDVQLYYQMLLLGRRDLSLAPDLQMGFEMLMLRLHAFRPLAARTSAESSAETSQPKKPLAPSDGAQQVPREGARQVRIELDSAAPPAAVPNPRLDPVPEERDDTAAEHWIRLFAQLPLDGMMRSLCSHLSLEQRDGKHWVFCRDAEGAGLFSDKHRERLQTMLIEAMQEPVEIRIEDRPGAFETPAQRSRRLHLEEIERARATLMELPEVQRILREFDGVLDADSIRIEHKH